MTEVTKAKQTDLPVIFNEAQATFLTSKTPPDKIKTRKARGGMVVSYVEHSYVTDLLNKAFGFDWDWDIMQAHSDSGHIVVLGKLTVRSGGKSVSKTQYGGSDIKRFTSGLNSGQIIDLADDYKSASSDALKKCSSLLGIGLDLYQKADEIAKPSEETTKKADDNAYAEKMTKFAKAKALIGNEKYYEILSGYTVSHANELKDFTTMDKALADMRKELK